VVDDNMDAASSLALLLGLAGHETHAAFDGQEAIDRAEEVRPDVILLDLGLPKISGYDVCRRIREKPWGSNVTVIALTGWGQDTDRRKTRDAGFDHHIVKPIEHSRLLELLARS
jgi:CheY-like chemotaxis protein